VLVLALWFVVGLAVVGAAGLAEARRRRTAVEKAPARAVDGSAEAFDGSAEAGAAPGQGRHVRAEARTGADGEEEVEEELEEELEEAIGV
jgi:hypothetical protein